MNTELIILLLTDLAPTRLCTPNPPGRNLTIHTVEIFTLERTDLSRKISRFYLLAVQPELFGRWRRVHE